MSAERPKPNGERLKPIAAALSFRRISAVYIWIALFVLFALWVPDTFLTSSTLKSVLSEQAITAMVAVGLVAAFAAGSFDLSVGYTLGLGAILVALFDVDTGMPVWLEIALAIAAACAVGAINGILVATFRINSFIATLGVGSCLAALIQWVSGTDTVVGLSPGLQSIATGDLLGVAYPVYYMLVVAGLLGYFLEHTPTGRYIYATGGNLEAARLSGVPTSRLLFLSLVLAGGIAGIAGVLATAQVGAGSPTVGPPYLLSALAAVLLGSTQINPGRPNVWGTVLAVYVLATGVKGLQLAGAPFWLPDAFNGVALLLAVGLANFERRKLARAKRGVARARQADDVPSRAPSRAC